MTNKLKVIETKTFDLYRPITFLRFMDKTDQCLVGIATANGGGEYNYVASFPSHDKAEEYIKARGLKDQADLFTVKREHDRTLVTSCVGGMPGILLFNIEGDYVLRSDDVRHLIERNVGTYYWDDAGNQSIEFTRKEIAEYLSEEHDESANKSLGKSGTAIAREKQWGEWSRERNQSDLASI